MSCEHEWHTVDERILYRNDKEEHVEAELHCIKCGKVAVAFARRIYEEEEE